MHWFEFGTEWTNKHVCPNIKLARLEEMQDFPGTWSEFLSKVVTNFLIIVVLKRWKYPSKWYKFSLKIGNKILPTFSGYEIPNLHIFHACLYGVTWPFIMHGQNLEFCKFIPGKFWGEIKSFRWVFWSFILFFRPCLSINIFVTMHSMEMTISILILFTFWWYPHSQFISTSQIQHNTCFAHQSCENKIIINSSFLIQ